MACGSGSFFLESTHVVFEVVELGAEVCDERVLAVEESKHVADRGGRVVGRGSGKLVDEFDSPRVNVDPERRPLAQQPLGRGRGGGGGEGERLDQQLRVAADPSQRSRDVHLAGDWR